MFELSETGIEALYRELKRYGQVLAQDRRLPTPPADSVTVRSPLCGSALTLDAVISHGRVRELGWAARTCALGQASTAIVIAHVPQLDVLTVGRVEAQLRALLAGHDEPLDWQELELFTLARDIPSRHDSVLLPFAALQQLFARAGGAARSSGPES